MKYNNSIFEVFSEMSKRITFGETTMIYYHNNTNGTTFQDELHTELKNFRMYNMERRKVRKQTMGYIMRLGEEDKYQADSEDSNDTDSP